MLIPVIYPDGKHDMVKSYLLDRLIAAQQIRQFRRSDGWVNIDSKQIRGKSHNCYLGPERRVQQVAAAS